MTDALAALTEQVVAEGGGFLFLSPHLDDAVLSCGALMSTLAERAPVTVATVFTAAGPPPHTRAASAFLRQCAVADAEGLYAERCQEDVEVLAGMGVASVHLGVPDALFRQRVAGPVLSRVGRVLPEAVHRYPTFRLDIARGRVARGDRTLADELDGRIRDLVEQTDARLVFSPVGVGRHVDHLLTRRLGARYPARRVLYSDFPYDRTHSPDARYLAEHGLRPAGWDAGLAGKRDLIRGYRTQVEALFPSGEIPIVPETYYLPSSAVGSSSAAVGDAGRGEVDGARRFRIVGPGG